MKRNFPDFIEAYYNYALDDFCPPKFHLWTAFSVLAGACERKVWIPRETHRLFPNVYVLLIARPGVGKSSAASTGMKLLRALDGDHGPVHFLATQNSEASFIEQAARYKEFFVNGQKHTHASSFLYASEASNSLKEMVGGGTITPALTEFYDCPGNWKKELKTQTTEINNCAVSLLACSTFSFLRSLVPQNEAEGGFASRLLYIIEDEIVVRSPKWHAEGRKDAIYTKLLEDLQQIYGLSGGFRTTRSFSEAYEQWFPLQDMKTQEMKSEKMQHFMARKHTNVLKLAMLCAVSESNDLVLEFRHWQRALDLMEDLEAKLPVVVNYAQNKESQGGIVYSVLKSLADAGGVQLRGELTKVLLDRGIDVNRAEAVLTTMQKGELISIQLGGPGQIRYKLRANPNDYL